MKTKEIKKFIAAAKDKDKGVYSLIEFEKATLIEMVEILLEALRDNISSWLKDRCLPYEVEEEMDRDLQLAEERILQCNGESDEK